MSKNHFDVRKVGQWPEARAILDGLGQRAAKAESNAVKQEALFFERKIKEGIRDQAPGGKPFEPLKESTIAGRRFEGFRGTKALIRSGTLLRNVALTRISGGYFVGILRGTMTPDGKSLVNIAEIMENGAGPYVIQVTPAMRRYLGAMFAKSGTPGSGVGGGGGLITVRIPPRPVYGPVMEKYGDEAQVRARIVERLQKALFTAQARKAQR